jgi:protein SCO1/2
MAFLVVVVAALAVGVPGCRRQPPARQFQLTGQVLAVAPRRAEITIRHDAVQGFMPAMVMPFKVKDRTLTEGRLPGDLVKATLMVTDEESWLSTLEKTGWAPFSDLAPGAMPGVAPVKGGDVVPDETLIDQEGRSFRLSSLRGGPVLLTFIYTRCPLPDFCPRMDRNFQAVQKAIGDGRLPSTVRLVSVSFDPDYDTPATLKAHAAAVGADPRTWTFATAPRAQVEAFGASLGLSVIRDEKNPDMITHNLRTAVLDPSGRLVTMLNGNEWTVDQALKAVAGAATR